MNGRQRLALAVYSALWWLVAPLAALYLLWRSLIQREYRRHWAERFLGHGAPAAGRPVIWVHAVSVGETRAAQPLIERLAAEWPDANFLLTHMTPTGRAVGSAVAAALPGRVVQRYLPYDLRGAVDRFFRQTRPAVGIVMETEIWPNLLHGARRAGVPVLLANARLSEKSLARGRRFESLLRPAVQCFAAIAAQSNADRERIAPWYDGQIVVTGNLKFDLAVDETLVAAGRALRRAWGERPVWLFASTREGEEALLVEALRSLRGRAVAEPLIVVVPRHPQRFDDVAQLIERAGFACLRRSRGPWPVDVPDATLLLGDTMGEMALYYAAADVALIGGSLREFGAHNLIEACAVGTPVIVGPSTYNFAQVIADALAAGAALQASDADSALAAMAALCKEPSRRAAMGESALHFATAHRGATTRVATLVNELIRL